MVGGTVNGVACPAGQALLGSVPTAFTNITTYRGLPTGNTTFVAGTPGGSTFSAASGTSNNTIDYSAATTGVTVNLGATAYVTGTQNPIPGVTVGSGQVLGAKPPLGQTSCAASPLPSFCDRISNLTTVTGSSGGANTFVAGTGSENFGDTGSKGGDSIDFSGLSTNSGSPLAVNVAGPAVGSLQNFTATLGTTATYNFTAGGSNFTNFTGSASGNTTFYAGKVGGYSFSGSGSDTVDFSQTTSNPAVIVNLSGGPSSGSITGFANGLKDTMSGLTTVTGSPNGGNRFTAGPGPAVYTFTASGNSNVFTGGAGPDVFSSTGSNNLVTVGTGSATFTDTAGSGNEMDFSQLPAPSTLLPAGDPVTVNVSGFQDGATQNNQATGALGGVYTFGASTTTFNGSPGGSTFDAGGVADTFVGIPGAANNILNFGNVQSAVVGLKVCVVSGTVNGVSCPAGQAFLGSVPTAFTNINTYKGLPTGNTTFVAGSPGGSTFSAASGTSNNSIDYSAAGSGVTVNLAATPGTVGPNVPTCAASPLPSSCDSISNLTTVTGSSKGANTFVAGSGAYNLTGNGDRNTFSGGAGASSFSSNGNQNVFNVGTGPDTISDTGTGNAISFKAVPTSSTTLLNVNISTTPVNGLFTDTASAGPVTYNFTTGGSGFTSFTGANNGFTYFDASATGGYAFSGFGSNNTVDFNTDPSGVVANTQTGTVCVSAGACTTPNTDTIADITTIIGSASGANVFDGGLTGTTFKSASPTNTVSYVGYTTSGLCFNLTTDQVTPGPACGVSSPADTFKFTAPSGTATVEGTPQTDTFQPGAAGVTVQGGGGNDALDLSQIPAPATGTTGATVDLDAGSVTLPGVAGSGATTFLPGCGASAPATDLCLTTVNGSKYNDSFTANADALSVFPALLIQGGTGSDALSLADIDSPATINLPITSGTPPAGAKTCSGVGPSATGVVCATNPVAGAKNITFKNILTVTGTANGGDRFFAGSGTENLSENGTPGTLDYSQVPLPANSTTGITVEADASGTGSVSSPTNIGVGGTFTNMGTFNGTAYGDTFSQVRCGLLHLQWRAGLQHPQSVAGAGGDPGVAWSAGFELHRRDQQQRRLSHGQRCRRQLHLHGHDPVVHFGVYGAARRDGHRERQRDRDAVPRLRGAMHDRRWRNRRRGDRDHADHVQRHRHGHRRRLQLRLHRNVDRHRHPVQRPFHSRRVHRHHRRQRRQRRGELCSGTRRARWSTCPHLPTRCPRVPTPTRRWLPTPPSAAPAGRSLLRHLQRERHGERQRHHRGRAGLGDARRRVRQRHVPPDRRQQPDHGRHRNQHPGPLSAAVLLDLQPRVVGPAATGDRERDPRRRPRQHPESDRLAGGEHSAGRARQHHPGRRSGRRLAGRRHGHPDAHRRHAAMTPSSAASAPTTSKAAPKPVTFVPGQGGTDTLSSQMTDSREHSLLHRGAVREPRSTCPTSWSSVGGIQLQPQTAAGGWGATVQNLSGAQINQIIGSPAADIFYTGSTPTTDPRQRRQRPVPCDQRRQHPHRRDRLSVSDSSSTARAATSSTAAATAPWTSRWRPPGVSVNLPARRVATGGFGGSRSPCTGILNVVGTNSADVLVGGRDRRDAHRHERRAAMSSKPAPPAATPSSPAAAATDTFCAQVNCNGGRRSRRRATS